MVRSIILRVTRGRQIAPEMILHNECPDTLWAPWLSMESMKEVKLDMDLEFLTHFPMVSPAFLHNDQKP